MELEGGPGPGLLNPRPRRRRRSSVVPDPRALPEWHALGREAALVRHLIGAGVTALGNASYADKRGEYYIAFFGLSVGLERLAKLILVADYALVNRGRMPEPEVVKRRGHNLSKLLGEVDEIALKHNLMLRYQRPSNEIVGKIVECLHDFADASRGRYANFAELTSPNLHSEFEPIRKWWAGVAEPILAEHFSGKPVQRRAETNARQVALLFGDHTLVSHTSELGDSLDDAFSASLHSGQSQVVQQYGRYYALTLVRWLSGVLSKLTDKATGDGIDAFFGLEEYFETFLVNDGFLKTRKVWPLR